VNASIDDTEFTEPGAGLWLSPTLAAAATIPDRGDALATQLVAATVNALSIATEARGAHGETG
jgi:ABC-type thiamin/hydroxymethylpyrimidine transport system permease subunit